MKPVFHKEIFLFVGIGYKVFKKIDDKVKENICER